MRKHNRVNKVKAKRYIDPRSENDHPLCAPLVCKPSLMDPSNLKFPTLFIDKSFQNL
jgi:hypothetical protein